LYAAGSHPDAVQVFRKKDKQQISVDQIRATNERLGMTSSRDAPCGDCRACPPDDYDRREWTA
jgi:hypothetical protein